MESLYLWLSDLAWWHFVCYVVVILLFTWFDDNLFGDSSDGSWLTNIADFVDKYRKVFLLNGIYSLCKFIFVCLWVLMFPFIFLVKLFVVEFNISWFFKRIQ